MLVLDHDQNEVGEVCAQPSGVHVQSRVLAQHWSVIRECANRSTHVAL